jgi:hypothetical protein
MDALAVVRSRVFANYFFRRCVTYWGWSFAALCLLGVFLPLSFLLAAALFVLVGCAAASFLQGWAARPSAYELARQLDQAAGLQDRIPTALHFSALDPRDEISLRQRRDALEHLTRVDARSLFPYHFPARANCYLAVALAFAALLAYRSFTGAPKVQLAQVMRPWQQVKKLLPAGVAEASPSQANRGEPDQRPSDTEPLDVLAADAAKNPEDPRNTPAIPKDSPDNSSKPEDPSAAPGASPVQLETDSPRPLEEMGDNSEHEPQKENAPLDDVGRVEGGEKSEKPMSVGQRIKNAFGSLLAMMSDRPSEERENAASNAVANQQSPQSALASPGATQKSTQSASNGPPNSSVAGTKGDLKGDKIMRIEGQVSQPGSRPGSEVSSKDDVAGGPHPQDDPVTASVTRKFVPLRPTKFKGEATVVSRIVPYEASVKERRVMPGSKPAAEGAEQGTVPVQYRFYIQRYFDR